MHILVDIFIFIFSGINVFIDFGLLHSIFISRTLPKPEFLTLFYFRLFIDGIAGLGTFLATVIDVLNTLSLWTNPSKVISFFILHPFVHITTILSLLVVFITVDRIFAVFFPISYRAYRSKIRNWVLILFVSVSPVFDNFVLIKMCNFNWRFPADCMNYTCLVNQCFLQCTVAKEMVEHGIIVIGSLAIAVKLFLFNKEAKNKNLEKANQLTLIDATVIFIFYLIPSCLILVYPFFSNTIEITLPLTKVSGYALDGYLGYRILKQRSDIKSKVKAKTSVASRILFKVSRRRQ